jgi:hypothetical protein
VNALIKSIEAEFRRYKALAESALTQVPEPSLSQAGPSNGNSLAVICRHVSGNFKSRFSDFLTTDGEKPWRNREEEFLPRSVSRAELMANWAAGWDVLLGTMRELTDADLSRTIQIRGQSMLVHEALHRSLGHLSYHVGQIVYLAHALCGAEWRYLTIPPGRSADYNANPQFEKADSHANALTREYTR